MKLSFKARLYLLTFAIIVLLLLFVYLNALEVKADEAESRPRYTLFDSRFSFLFANSDTLPFVLIREMCWNPTDGFCDSGLEGADEIYLLIDWNPENPVYGAVFETDSGACFWWSYQSEFGEDNNPHIQEHYWITCPTISLN